MGNGSSRAHRLAVLAILLDLITFAVGIGFIFVAIGHDANSSTECISTSTLGSTFCKGSPNTSLGVWNNMPSAQTELMGNTSYRQALAGNFAGLIANLGVGCIIASNTVGAKLTLQYALYSTITGANTTNFQNTNTVVFIDQTTNPTCLLSGSVSPQVSTTSTTLNSTGSGYLFRVVGSGGGGTGDSPRFYSVYVQLTTTTTRATTIVVSVRSTTAFTAFAYVAYPLASTTTENFDWIATNSTALVGTDTQHGSSSCAITAGAASCSIATTFVTPFLGTPSVTCTSRNPAIVLTIPVGVLNLLQAQTLTV